MALPAPAARPVEPAPPVELWPGLRMVLDIRASRAGRARCPGCGRRRVLIRLQADDGLHTIGHGVAKCYACAGLRP